MTAPARAPVALFLLLALAGPARALTIEEIGAPGAPGEDGQSVRASGSEVASDNDPAEVIATAIGGTGGAAPAEGGPAGNGGRAGLGPLYAASDTGEVTVEGSATGGAGGPGASGPAGDGGSAWLRNSVDGDTTGRLELLQSAQGGSPGLLTGGEAGSASSYLHRRKAAESFQLESQAIGGGSSSISSRAIVAEGAPARATGKGSNNAGLMRTLVSAKGGAGGASGAWPGEDGGDATVVALGRSQGDGNPVFVGIRPLLRDVICHDFGGTVECPPDEEANLSGPSGTAHATGPGETSRPGFPLFVSLPDIGAHGGAGGGFLSTFLPSITSPAGDGGEARSRSVGIAEGDSSVDVRDIASGGSGGFQVGVDEGGPSRGGSGHSVALGVGRGSSAVNVNALATGGSSGSVARRPELPGLPEVPFFPPVDGVSGAPADASAVAIGEGEANATATAAAGLGTASGVLGPRHAGGMGEAVAKAVGSSGRSTAAARSSSQTLQVQVSAEAGVLHSATSDARIGSASPRHVWQKVFDRLAHRAGARDASVDATVAPADAAVANVLRRQRELRHALEDAGVDTIDALGSFTARQRQRSHGEVLTSALEIELSPIPLNLGVGTDPVFVGLFAPHISHVGFESLHVLMTNGNEVLVDQLFTDPRAAESFLDSALLEVGVIGAVGNPFPPMSMNLDRATLRVELATYRAGAGLRLHFLVGQARGAEDDAAGATEPARLEIEAVSPLLTFSPQETL